MVRVAYRKPCNLVPRLGTKGYRFHDRFHIVMDCGGLGLILEPN